MLFWAHWEQFNPNPDVTIYKVFVSNWLNNEMSQACETAYIFDFLSVCLFNLLSFLLLSFRLFFDSFCLLSRYHSAQVAFTCFCRQIHPSARIEVRVGEVKPIWTIPSFWGRVWGRATPPLVHQYQCIWFYPGESIHPDESNKTLHTKWKNSKNLGACPSFLFQLLAPSHLICVKIIWFNWL